MQYKCQKEPKIKKSKNLLEYIINKQLTKKLT